MKSLLLLIPLLFTGCFSSYPLNLSEAEYNQLTFEEKLRAKEYQTKIQHEQQLEREKTKRHQAQLQYELTLNEHKRLEKLYKKSDEILFVSITGGSFKHMKKGYYIRPFEIRPYEVKKIPVFHKKYNSVHHHIWVSYQPEALYLGVVPLKHYKHMKSYMANNSDLLFRNYDKPYIIPRSSKWRDDTLYTVSFKDNYDAMNIKVRLFLEKVYKGKYRY